MIPTIVAQWATEGVRTLFKLGVFVEKYCQADDGDPEYPEPGDWQLVLDYAIAAGQIGTSRTTSLMAFKIDAFPVVGETCQRWLDEWLEQSLGGMAPPPAAVVGGGNGT